ncbi:uro-adherence factor A-like [Littorina saxatilis]|uniref:Uncharacterized protein n=1 Tax=Littorina saxatilis TaxID=31220 RepID=A0AAN9BHV4_9CAEN
MKQLAGQQRPKYRLSPNEVEQLKKAETERRRKLRIIQVREQSKAAAAKIRSNVKTERKRQLLKLAHEIEDQMEEEKQEEVNRLEQQYDNTLRTIGQGHSQAIVTDQQTSHAKQQFAAYENKQRAGERHQEALRRVALDKAYKVYDDTQHIRDRRAALLQEKKRAADMAARPPPPPDAISNILQEKDKLKKPIPMTDMNAFSTTHYHIPDYAVEKAPLEQQLDGKAAGDEEDERTKEEVSERRKRGHDQLVRAKIRGKEALQKEMLKHDYDELLADLSVQQRADRRRRQVVVSKLPKQVFLPPDRRMEELDDKQMEMERAFEDMYLKQLNLSGDMSLTLDPNPIPSTPAEGGDASLATAEDSPIVIPTMPAVNPALRELTNISRVPGQTAQQAKPETALKKLLNKIKEQRSEADSEKTLSQYSSQENIGSKSPKTGVADKGPHTAAARQPVSRPGADPDLDLSPVRAPGNQKLHKSPAMRARQLAAENEADLTDMTSESEEGFLEQLQSRLQAIEAQKNYLDRKMRERQENIGQHTQHTQHTQPSSSYTDFPAQSSSQPQGAPVFFSSSAGPKTATEAPPIRLVPQPSVLSQSWGPSSARDVDKAPVPAPDLWKQTSHGINVLSSQPQSIPQGAYYQPQPVGVETRNAASSEMNYFRQPISDLRSLLSVSRPANEMSVGSEYSLALGLSHTVSGFPNSQVFDPSRPFPLGASVTSIPQEAGLQSQGASAAMGGLGGVARGRAQQGAAASSGYPYLSAVGSVSGLGSLPAQSFPTLSSMPPASSATSRSGVKPASHFHAVPATSLQAQGVHSSLQAQGVHSSLQAQGVHSNLPPSSLPTQVSSEGLLPTFASRPSRAPRSGLADTGDHRPSLFPSSGQSQSQRSGYNFGTLDPSLSEAERVQRLRDYQRQLIDKHQERMKSLQDVRSQIQTRRMESGSLTTSSLLSASQRLTDPASLVPYTLKTTAVSEGGVGGRSLSSHPPAVPLSAHSGSALPAPVSAGLSAPYSTAETLGAEPILAGSAGISVGRGPIQQDSGFGTRPSNLSSLGQTGGTTKVDSVRKSLPFDDPDDTLRRDDGGDTDGISLADDSHISSSTDRGSPSLGSRSYKPSTSGRSGLSGESSGLSGGYLSGGSLGGCSLVARAEEKRISFEQRQVELQHQLAEIQRQKDALLQRYHGNQQKVSSQEEDLRRKLRTAQAATATTTSTAAPRGGVSLQQQPASAVSLGVHQSTSPNSTQPGDGSLSARHLASARGVARELDDASQVSNSRSWAVELEEYSLQDGRERLSYKGPANLTLEEFSITSDWSGGAPKDAARSTGDTRPGSGLSSLEEYSFVSGNGRLTGDAGSRESLSAPQGNGASASKDNPDSARGRLDIKDLLQDLGSTWPGEGQAQGGDAENNGSDRLPPPPTRQPVPVTVYEPHELSTILEVDTPQTGAKSTVTMATEGAAKAAARRCIEFGRHGTVTEDDRTSESKLLASGSSASSDVRSVIEVRPGMLRSGNAGGSTGEGTLQRETLFRANVPQSSTMKRGSQDGEFHAAQPHDISATSSTQGFHSLEMTLDSLTPRSHTLDNPKATRSFDFERDGAWRVGEKGNADDVLRQARQFNQDLMSAIQRQSADVFDQSSLSSLSQTAGDSTQTSQQ